MLVFHICRDGGKFHSIIYSEVEDRVTNLVGQANFTCIQVVKQNGKGICCCLCIICLAYSIPPQTVQFDICMISAYPPFGSPSRPSFSLLGVFQLLFRMPKTQCRDLIFVKTIPIFSRFCWYEMLAAKSSPADRRNPPSSSLRRSTLHCTLLGWQQHVEEEKNLLFQLWTRFCPFYCHIRRWGKEPWWKTINFLAKNASMSKMAYTVYVYILF